MLLPYQPQPSCILRGRPSQGCVTVHLLTLPSAALQMNVAKMVVLLGSKYSWNNQPGCVQNVTECNVFVHSVWVTEPCYQLEEKVIVVLMQYVKYKCLKIKTPQT